ncbi:peroxiredoxin [Rhodobacteraceae bacterium RKSG542]|uniref:peroxiredoxin n=1 Tax=Pseudovibrio flavus TaxID=2529854 RepID=UPI0012BBD0D4|nr:peroxiredoxin [Pseudovibrio flavus]MTI17271.1 peroxiredoxin [Pseudovibrio flavus]
MSTLPLSEGSQIADFELETDGAGTFKLSSSDAAAVVLYFYPKDDTPGCTKEAIAFTALHEQFAALGVKVVGVSPDTTAKHDKFKAKHDLTVTLLSDSDKKLCESFGVWVEKSMYGKKYMGVERSTFLLKTDGTIVKAWRKVKVPGHAEAVLEEAKSLLG